MEPYTTKGSEESKLVGASANLLTLFDDKRHRRRAKVTGAG